MSLTAFLVSNALLVLVLLSWNLFTLVSLRNASSEGRSHWTASVGLQWRFGAATAALIAVTLATLDAILFGESDEIIEIAGIFSILAYVIAVSHAIVSVLLIAEINRRGLTKANPSFDQNAPWRHPIEWATLLLVPLTLLGAFILGMVASA